MKNKINLVCPINEKHTHFEKHYFELYDSSDFVTNSDKLIRTDTRDQMHDEVDRNLYAGRVLHCIRCAECSENGDEWDDIMFQKFQQNFFDQVGRDFKETHYVNKIMDIVEGYDDNSE